LVTSVYLSIGSTGELVADEKDGTKRNTVSNKDGENKTKQANICKSQGRTMMRQKTRKCYRRRKREEEEEENN